MTRMKRRVFEILESISERDTAANAITAGIVGLILLNVAAMMVETMNGYSARYSTFFRVFEAGSVAIFTLEYVLRLWACTLYDEPQYRSPLGGRIRLALTPLALVDLMSFLPFYVHALVPLDLRFMRVVRLLRLFRLGKLARYSESIRTLGVVLKAKREPLVLTVFVAGIVLVFASNAMYILEHEAQPTVFPSVPAAMWWAVVTMTTIGYGDVYPVTALGKILAAVVAFGGIGMFALPAGILASGFIEELQKRRANRICPHCGREIDDTPS